MPAQMRSPMSGFRRWILTLRSEFEDLVTVTHVGWQSVLFRNLKKSGEKLSHSVLLMKTSAMCWRNFLTPMIKRPEMDHFSWPSTVLRGSHDGEPRAQPILTFCGPKVMRKNTTTQFSHLLVTCNCLLLWRWAGRRGNHTKSHTDKTKIQFSHPIGHLQLLDLVRMGGSPWKSY